MTNMEKNTDIIRYVDETIKEICNYFKKNSTYLFTENDIIAFFIIF